MKKTVLAVSVRHKESKGFPQPRKTSFCHLPCAIHIKTAIFLLTSLCRLLRPKNLSKFMKLFMRAISFRKPPHQSPQIIMIIHLIHRSIKRTFHNSCQPPLILYPISPDIVAHFRKNSLSFLAGNKLLSKRFYDIRSHPKIIRHMDRRKFRVRHPVYV